ncbi:MAG: 3-dehydroquinase [Candidatus Binatia bacterium]|nr:MAG: 3-dehydroquinase [Candidatus Binatia bacterium]
MGPKTLSIGGVSLGKVPRVVVPLFDDDPRADVSAVQDLCDFVELRIDGFSELAISHVSETAKRYRKLAGARLPLIATVRAQSEGGKAPLDEETRATLYECVLGSVDAVDVELRAPIRDRVLELARKTGRTTIVSFHDFASTPSLETLERLWEEGRACRADLLKVATMAHDLEDVARLLEFTLRHRQEGIVTVAMGAVGGISRVFFPAAGSRLTYAHHRAPTAPGQLSLLELRELLRRFYPGS